MTDWSAWSLRGAAMGALFATCVLGSGCAQERDPINRVGANVMSKHFFIGADLSDAKDDPEFYWRNYVVGGSASQSLTGIGSWGGVDRIKWEVTEKMLVVRKSYQVAAGQDVRAQTDPNAPGGVDAYGNRLVQSESGTVVAAYQIQSHFDIRRAYNPQTGEELNIVEENTSDRPWNQREYMRIDWSTNIVDNPMWEDMFLGKVFGNITVAPLAYSVTDPRNVDAPHLDEKEGYLDITNKYWLTPAQTASPFSDYTAKVPTCVVIGIFTGSATYECDPQEAIVRHSYWRIDDKHDFEPLENTNANLDVIGNPGGLGDSRSVGIVTAGRQGFDPQYGYTDKLYHRFAHHHNVWKKSHQDATCTSNDDLLDGTGATGKNGTADQCENSITKYAGATGSQCDVFTKKCTIPNRDRQVKTIGYWINADAPKELLDKDLLTAPTSTDPDSQYTRGTLEDLIYSWNQMMSVALAYSREVECRRTGDGSRDECHAQFFDSTDDPNTKVMVSFGGWLTDKVKEPTPAVTFCHNPVRAYDLHGTCGDTGALARVGDVRKNFIFYWPYDSRAPWGGIADWNADPLTGEIIGGAAQIMGRSATYAAALERDVLQIAMGDLKIDDLIQGAPATTYSKVLQQGSMPETALSVQELDRRVNSIDSDAMRRSMSLPQPPTDLTASVLAQVERQKLSSNDPTQFSNALLAFDTYAKKLQNTPEEAQLVDSSWLVSALGASPTTSLSDEVLDRASPLRGMDPGRIHAMNDVLQAGLHARGVCFLENEAPAYGSVQLPSLAGYFKAKYGSDDSVTRGQKMYQDLWKETVKGIALHEIGHSLGMLHQFASSWDSMNYQPQYWQLRTNEGKSTPSCNGQPRAPGDNDTCMGPRYLDPETKDEQGLAGESRPDVQYFGNTSTMEYQLERFGETAGLGTYDLHTMKALYGRVLETLDDRQLPTPVQQGARWRAFSQLIERDLYQQGNSVTFRHYTEMARILKIFDPARDCRAATSDEKQTGEWRIVHNKVCAPEPRDHWAWQDFPASDQLKPFNNTAPYFHAKVGSKDYVRWFYRWGSTHNAYFHTNDSDAGADAYEVTMNTIHKFDVTYPWTYFRRQNREYYYRSIPSRIADTYFERVRSYHWQIANTIARSQPNQLKSDDDARPEAIAQGEIFNFLARAMVMPEPGGYVSSDTDGSIAATKPPEMGIRPIFDVPGFAQGAPAFNVAIADGRFIVDQYDNSLGGSWDYLHWMMHAGFSMEKEMAISALVDGRPTLYTISRENVTDGRNNMINFRTDLPQGLDRFVGGIMSGDWSTVAMSVPPSGADTTPRMLDLTPTDTQPARATADARILAPNLGYKQQLGTAMMVALYSRLSSDLTLVNKMRLWVEGQVGGITIPDAQQVRFTNPLTGYTYVARKYGTEKIDDRTVDKGIASRMLAHANTLLSSAYKVTRDGQGNPVLDAFGRPTVALDANGLPISEFSGGATEQDMVKYVGLLDSVKQIEYQLGYGPL